MLVVATADIVEVAFLSVAYPFAEVVEHIDLELRVQAEYHIVQFADLVKLVHILLLDLTKIEVVVEIVVVAVAVEEAVNSLFAEVFDREIDSLVGLEAAAVSSSCYTSLGRDGVLWRGMESMKIIGFVGQRSLSRPF